MSMNECVTSQFMRMRHVAFKCVRHTAQMTYRLVEMGLGYDYGVSMGWLRLVGSINYRSLLQKSPIKETIFCKRDLELSILLTVATPYN